MGEKPEKMDSQKEKDTPKNPEKKEVIPPVPQKGVPIDEAPQGKPEGKKETSEPKSEAVMNLEEQITSAKKNE